MPRPAPHDLHAIAMAALCPARPQYRAARKAEREYLGQPGLLEGLVARGLLAEAWAYDPRRRAASTMICARCQGQGEDDEGGCVPCEGMGLFYHLEEELPPGVAVLLAMDPAGTAATEHLARQFVADFAAFGAPPCEQVAWRLLPDLLGHPYQWLQDPTQPYEAGPGLRAAVQAFRSAHRRLNGEELSRASSSAYERVHEGCLENPRQGPRYTLLSRLNHLIEAEDTWRVLADAGERALDGRPLRACPNPWTTLLALWSHGYVLEAVVDGTILLAALAE